MVRKASTASKKHTTDGDKGEANKIRKKTATTAITPEQDIFTILVTGQASKIGQKSEGTIGYEVIKDQENARLLYFYLCHPGVSPNTVSRKITDLKGL